MPGYRFLEHTADAGVEIEAPNRTEIFRLALRALTDCLTVLDAVEAVEEESILLRGDGLDLLLVDFLQELLFRFEVRGFLASDAQLRLRQGDNGRFELAGVIRGEPFEAKRHAVKLPIKAVTYHELAFEPVRDGFFARVIFDV